MLLRALYFVCCGVRCVWCSSGCVGVWCGRPQLRSPSCCWRMATAAAGLGATPGHQWHHVAVWTPDMGAAKTVCGTCRACGGLVCWCAQQQQREVCLAGQHAHVAHVPPEPWWRGTCRQLTCGCAAVLQKSVPVLGVWCGASADDCCGWCVLRTTCVVPEMIRAEPGSEVVQRLAAELVC
jgi:hypothetical protein